MSYTYTKRADLVKHYRKIAGTVEQGYNFASPEVAEIEKLSPETTTYSPREVLFPIDLNAGYGAASIEDFGFEAMPSTPDLEEAQEDVIHINARFNLSKMAKISDKGGANQVENVLKRSAMKKGEAIRRWIASGFYGFDDAVVAITDTDLSSATPTLTMKDGYGRTDIDNAEYLARKFEVGEWVALVAAGSDALIDANAIGKVTSRSITNGTITLALIGSVTYSTNGIRIVKANAAGTGLDQTITGSDLGKGLVGLLQANTAASLHGLTHVNWANAYTDTTGGRFNAQRLRRGEDEVADRGNGKLNMVIMDRGVYRDTVALQSAALRFSDPNSLSLDGNITATGKKFFQGNGNIPPGYVFGMDKSAISKWLLTEIPSENESESWSNGKEYIDRSGFVFSSDCAMQLVYHCRAKLALWSGLDRQ